MIIRTVVFITFLLVSSTVYGAEKVDIILQNGVIFTSEEKAPLYSAIAIKGDIILAVGGSEIMDHYTASKVIDLKGRLLIPGFNDAHLHIEGQPAHFFSITKFKSIKEILAALKERVKTLEPGEWITGYSWSEDELAEKRRIFRKDLDSVTPNNPVILTRAGSHSAVANSMALAIAGLDENTPQPEKGMFEKDADGNLNGIIRELDALVYKHAPVGTPEDMINSMEATLRDRLTFGITSLTDAWTEPFVYEKYWKTIYARSGDSLPRATVQIHPKLRDIGLDESLKLFKGFKGKTGDGNKHLKVGALKVFVDGGFTGPAAWTIAPYKSDPDYYGTYAVKMDDFYKLGKIAHDNGWQMGIHAIGDRAITEAVDAIARILDENPRADHRHYLNHFTVMPSAETMDKMAKYKIAITQQPNFAYTLEGRYATHLGGENLQHNNSVRTPMTFGIPVALSSDDLPVGPMVGIYTAVTRKGMSGTVYGKEEAITVAEAIRAYTAVGAWINHDDDIKGTLTKGKLADMAILSQNILTIDPEKILSTKVDMTIVGGRILFERNYSQ